VKQVLGGAALVIAGIAAFIEAHSHAPARFSTSAKRSFLP
jgi:hypothetical protein